MHRKKPDSLGRGRERGGTVCVGEGGLSLESSDPASARA